VVKLKAISPCQDIPAQTIGSVTMQELAPAAITSIAVKTGRQKTASQSLKKQFGVALPGANRSTGTAGARCVWFGHDQVMLLGPQPARIDGASMTDQSDAWAVIQLQGRHSRAVLARMVPIDLNADVFKRGHTARTLLGHVPASLTRTGEDRFDLMVFRSMAHTVITEIIHAMSSISAQNPV